MPFPRIITSERAVDLLWVREHTQLTDLSDYPDSDIVVVQHTSGRVMFSVSIQVLKALRKETESMNARARRLTL